MKRVFGAVSGALRSLVPNVNAAAVPAAAHQERVRKAMESLAPPGRRLPSESKALAMELVAAAGPGGKGMPAKTPEEMYLAANALHLVSPERQSRLWSCTRQRTFSFFFFFFLVFRANVEGTDPVSLPVHSSRLLRCTLFYSTFGAPTKNAENVGIRWHRTGHASLSSITELDMKLVSPVESRRVCDPSVVPGS